MLKNVLKREEKVFQITPMQISLDNSFTEGASVRLYCNPGYIPTGETTATCEKNTANNLEWSEIGSCKAESTTNSNDTCPSITAENGKL